jgi:hypothetical protein
MARYNKIGIHIDAPEDMLEGPEEDLSPAPPPRPAAASDELSLAPGGSRDSLDL